MKANWLCFHLIDEFTWKCFDHVFCTSNIWLSKGLSYGSTNKMRPLQR